MPRSVSLSFRTSREMAKRLEVLSRATDRAKSWLLEQALDVYLDAQSWQTAHIEKGLNELRRGEGIPHEDVAEWLATWGTDQERNRPR